MAFVRIEQEDLPKELRVGDKIVGLGGYDLPGPFEVVSLHPGRATVKELDYLHLGEQNLFYDANKSVTVEREEI